MRMRKAFDHGRIFGTTHGRPPYRVLALPGWMRTAADYDTCLGSLHVDAGSVALDLPGFGGATPEPAAPMGSAGYAQAVAPVIEDDLDVPVVVVGHSFGGRVAVQLAASNPSQVRALVLTGAPLLRRDDRPPVKPGATFRAARMLHRRGVLSDERMEALRRRSGSADYRNAPSPVMRDVLVAVTNESYASQLRELRCPVELVWGEADEQVPISVAERAVAILGPKATLTTLPGTDHFVPNAAPEALVNAIRKHLG